MVDPQILKQFGSDNAQIRKLFTCEDPKCPEHAHRMAFEKKLSARMFSGWTASLQNSHLYAAADIAWDAAPIVRENIPLMLYAQKKIKIERCAEELDALGCSTNFVRRNADNTIKEIDLPRLYETTVNLVRSYLTRRLAPQATKYANLFPFMKYEPRATDLIGKLRGDALSQRVEIMADQFGYRHLNTQVIRDILLYGRSVLFPVSSWEREVQWQRKTTSDAFTPADPTKIPIESIVTREGVDFMRPHPSRIFWDMQYPLSSLNNNNGVNYVGFWDLRKYQDVLNDAAYFNRDKIRVSTSGRDFYASYRLYFDSQFNSQRIRFSSLADLRNSDPAVANDLLAVAPYYQSTDADESLFVSEYYEKVIPNKCGLGDYPFPVWMRLVVASDDTVVFGEFLPTSLPAIYFGYNENDNRAQNISTAHEIMPFQDQISNLLSQLLLTAKGNAFRIVALDTDAVPDEIRKELKATLAGDKYYVAPLLLEYSGIKARNLGSEVKNPIQFLEKRASDDITSYFRSITQLLAIIERLMVLSPQELGQAAPREISATEVTEIASSTSTLYNYISDAIDEGRAAWKKFIYEALVNKATEDVNVPVKERYSPDIVQAAGFSLTPMKGDCYVAQQAVTGAKEKLIHDYAFSVRDGSDRPSNTQAANTLVQLFSNMVKIPGILQAMGKPKLYELINEIFRMSGTGFDLKLEMAPGEDPSFGPQPDQLMEAIKQIEQVVQQQGSDLKDTQSQVQQIAKIIQQFAEQQKHVGTVMQAAADAPPPTPPTQMGETAPGVPGAMPMAPAMQPNPVALSPI